MEVTWEGAGSGTVTLRDQSWRTLRRMRSMPPGCAVNGSARAETFRTALEQSEQYFRAAETVGYEVKPVLVFYGLYQAARAVAAASPLLSDEDWRLSGHGIEVKESRDQADLSRVVIRSQNRKKPAAPQTVARALGSVFLPPESSTALADLWPLIPEAGQEPMPDSDLLRRCALSCTRERASGTLGIVACAEPTGFDAFQPRDGLVLAGLPRALADDKTLESIRSFLSGYPSLRGWALRSRSFARSPYRSVGTALKASFVVPVAKRGDEYQTAEMYCAVPYRGGRWVLPVVAGMDMPMHPLLAWWAVMLALSSLVRQPPIPS